MRRGVTGRVLDNPELTKLRAAVGTNWQVLSWLQVLPRAMLEHLNGRGSELVLMARVHLLH
jgi:hypothetical protein